MSSFNQIILMGHLSREPDLAYLQSQTPVVNFAIATNEAWKNSAGEKQESVCFVDCFMYGKRAKALKNHFKKGDAIHVVGKLVFDKWEKEGVKHYKHKVKIDSWLFVTKKVRKDDSSEN